MAFLKFLKPNRQPPYLYTPPITPFLQSRYTVFPPPTPPPTPAAIPPRAVMGSKPRIPVSTAVRRLRRRLSNSSRRLRKRQLSHHIGGAAPSSSSSVSGKLAALRNLIPSENAADTKPDQLFRETADYIVLLKTQVLVLQKLVDFYGSQSQENREGV